MSVTYEKSVRLHRRMLAGKSSVAHGSASTYRNYGCRCDACTKANTERARAEKQRRTERLARGEVNVEHGSASTYDNYCCRCEPCRGAHKARMAARRSS